MKALLLAVVIMTACREEFHPLSPPEIKSSLPLSGTAAEPPLSNCAPKNFGQNLLGSWTYTSNRLINPSGGSTKYSGSITFKVDMTFEDPDSLFGYRLQDELILARLYELQGDTLYLYVTDRQERQLGIIMLLQTADCATLKFVGAGKGGTVKVELTR